MAVLQVKGLDEYVKKIKTLSKNADSIMKSVVYDGGAVIADAVKAGLKELPVEEGENGLPVFGTQEAPITGVSRVQKGDLIDSMGHAPIQEFKQGYISTKLGWDGYSKMRTRKYPKGVPNQLLMRSVENGTSFRKKNPIVRKSVAKARKAAIEAMTTRAEKEIKEEFKNGN